MKLKDKLKKLRKEMLLTQEEASKQIGISLSSLRYYENGRQPDFENLKKLRNFYNVTYEYLLDDNCENKKIDDISINKKLHLSDKAIDNIIKCKNNYNALNLFIETFELDFFTRILETYNTCSLLSEYDIMALADINDICESIKETCRENNSQDLLETFKNNDIAVKNIYNFLSTNTVCMCLNQNVITANSLKEYYFNLKTLIFDTKYNSKWESSFNEAYEKFISIVYDILFILERGKKLCDYELTETFYKFKSNIDLPYAVDNIE